MVEVTRKTKGLQYNFEGYIGHENCTYLKNCVNHKDCIWLKSCTGHKNCARLESYYVNRTGCINLKNYAYLDG